MEGGGQIGESTPRSADILYCNIYITYCDVAQVCSPAIAYHSAMLVTLSSFTLTGFGADAVLSVSASVIASGKPEQTSVVLPAGPDTFTCVPDLTVTVPFRPSNGRPSTTDSVIRFSLYSTGDYGRVIIANAEIAAGAVASPGSSAVPVPWTASTLGLSGEITLSVNMDDGDAISDTEKVDAVSPVGGGKASSTDSEDASDDGTPAPAEPSQSFIPAPVVSAPTTAVSSRVASVAPSDAEPSSAEDEDEEGVQAVNGTIIVIAKQLDNLLDSHLTVRLVDGAGRVVDSGTALVASPGPLSPIPLRYANVTDAEGYAVVVEVGRNGSTAASGRVDASELMGAVSNADDEEADNSEDVSIALNSPSGELLTSITLSMSSACEAIRITPATPSPAPRTVPKRTPVLTPLSSAGGRKLGRPFLRTDSAGAVLSQLNTKSLALDRGISPADTADLQSEVGEGTSIASDSNWDGLSAVSGRSRFSLFKNKSAIPVGNQPKRHLGKRVMMLSGRLSVTLQSVSIAALVGDPVLSDDAQVTVAFELVEVVGDHLLSTGHAHPAPHTAGVCSWSEDPATVSLPYNAVRADVECAVLCKIWLTRDDMDEAVLLGSGTADANGWMGTSNPGRTCVIPLVVEDKGRIGEVSLTMASDCTSTAMSTIGPNTPVGWKQSRRHRGTMVPLAVGLTDERDPLTPQTAPAAVRRATAPVLRPRVSAITPAVEATPVAVLAQDTLCVCIPNTSSLCPVLSSSAAVTLVLTLSEGSRMVSSCSQVVTLGASNAADKEWKLPLTSLDPTASSHDTRFQTVQAAGYRLRLQVLDGSSGVQDGFVAMGEADVSLPISKVCPQIVPPRMKRAQGTVVSASIPIHNRNDFSLGCDLELKFRCDRPAQDPFSGASGVPSVPIPPASTPCWVVVSLNVLEVCYVSKAEVLLKRPALRQPGVGRGVTLKAVLVNECGHLLSVSHSGCAQLSWTAHTLQPFLFTDGTGSMQLCYRHRPSTGDDSRSSDVTSGWRVCVEVFGGKGLGDAIGFLEFTVSECHKVLRSDYVCHHALSHFL